MPKRTINFTLDAFDENDLIIFHQMVSDLRTIPIKDLQSKEADEAIRNKFRKYNGRAIQTFNNIILTLRIDGHQTQDAMTWIEGFDTRRKQISELMPRCPNCGALLRLFSLDFEIDGYKSIWRCSSCIGCKERDRNDETDPNKYCTYEKKNKKSYEQIMDEQIEEINKIMRQ